MSCKTALADQVTGLPQPSNPTLPPHTVVLQITPSNLLHCFGKHRFNFNPFNRIGQLVGFNHPADQKMFLLGNGFDRSPLGQQQFFWVQQIHG